MGGFFNGGIKEIVHRGGGDGPSSVQHKENSEEGGDRIEVPAPRFVPKEVGKEKRRSHEGIEGGFRKPEFGLRFHDGGGLLLGNAADTEVEAVAKEGGERKDADPGNGSRGQTGGDEVMGGLPGNEEGGGEHEEANGKADEIFEFTNPVGKTGGGGATDGANGEKSGEDRKKIGGFLKQITEDGEGVGKIRGEAHEGDIQQAEKGGVKEATFTCADG